MARLFRLVHADGREWAQPELDGLAHRLELERHIAPYDAECRAVCVDARGEPFMLNNWGEWRYIDTERYDLAVVWDEQVDENAG